MLSWINQQSWTWIGHRGCPEGPCWAHASFTLSSLLTGLCLGGLVLGPPHLHTINTNLQGSESQMTVYQEF